MRMALAVRACLTVGVALHLVFAVVASVALAAAGGTAVDPTNAEEQAALTGDDECSAAGADAGCTLSALQLRSGGARAEPEVQGPAPPKFACTEEAAPTLWAPDMAGTSLQVKVLSYNLFWWSLFEKRDGNGNSAGKLIAKNMLQPFDVMGFQECGDGERVLEPVGLLEKYEVFQGGHSICMAYNKENWALISHGLTDVAEDMATRYYGTRAASWMRLQSLRTDKKLFFMNHHGPLSINSGGACGGEATAYTLLQEMANNAQVGDLIVLVGDFNANAASLTIQTLWAHLVQAFVGKSWGGVDNVFTNAATTQVVQTEILGDGGSDHDAISVTIQVGGESDLESSSVSEPEEAVRELTAEAKPGYSWETYWCGLLEDGVEYVADPGAWTANVTGEDVADPDRCCRECQANPSCASWTWRRGPECLMSGARPVAKRGAAGVVSGRAYTAAAADAAEAAQHALTAV